MLVTFSQFYLLNQCHIDTSSNLSSCLLFTLFKACRITISSFHYSSKLQRLFYNVQHSWKNLSSGTELNHFESTSVDVLQTGQIYISQNYLSSLLFQAHLVVYLVVIHNQSINSFVLFKHFFPQRVDCSVIFRPFSTGVCFSYCLSALIVFSSILL